MLSSTPVHCKIKSSRQVGKDTEWLLEYPTEAFKQAACINTDVEFFYPDNEMLSKEHSMILDRICGRCPIKDTCLEWALCNEHYGLWANTTPKQRNSIRRKLRWSVTYKYMGWGNRFGL